MYVSKPMQFRSLNNLIKPKTPEQRAALYRAYAVLADTQFTPVQENKGQVNPSKDKAPKPVEKHESYEDLRRVCRWPVWATLIGVGVFIVGMGVDSIIFPEKKAHTEQPKAETSQTIQR